MHMHVLRILLLHRHKADHKTTHPHVLSLPLHSYNPNCTHITHTHAHTDCVRALASTSNEAPASLDQPLDHLRCLRLLEDVWHATWSSPSSHSHTRVPSHTMTINPDHTHAQNTPQQLLAQQLSALVVGEAKASGVFNGWGQGSELSVMMADAGGGGGNSSGLLGALRCAALRVSGARGALAHALAASVSDCRAARGVAQGAGCAQDLRALLTAVSSVPLSLPHLSSSVIGSTAAVGVGGRARGEGVGAGVVSERAVAEVAQLAAMLRPDAGVCFCVSVCERVCVRLRLTDCAQTGCVMVRKASLLTDH